MNPKDQLRLPLILKKIKIIDSKNKTLIGLEGTVIKETKHTLTIKTKEKTIRVIKKINVFELIFEEEGKTKKIIFEGKNIDKKPEDRIKTKIK